MQTVQLAPAKTMLQNEKRHTCRLPICEDEPRGQLSVGGTSWSVAVLDRSAAGFAVEVEQSCRVEPGDIVRLAWGAECSRLCVARKLESEGCLRLGLLRLEDLFAPDELPSSSPWPQLLHDRAGRSSSFLQYSVCVLVLAGMFLGASSAIVSPSTSWKLREMGFTPRESPPSASLRERQTRPVAVTKANLTDNGLTPVNRKNNSQRASVLNRASQQVAAVLPELFADSRQMPHTATQAAQSLAGKATRALETLLLDLPQYRGLLKLSTVQQQRVEEILAQSRAAMGEVQSRRAELGTQEVMQQIALIRQTAGQQVLAQLTAEQLLTLQKFGTATKPAVRTPR